VGCLTLVVILIGLFLGLWLDTRFDTRPLFIIIMMVASIPVTLFLMFRVVMKVAPKLQELTTGKTEKTIQETDVAE